MAIAWIDGFDFYSGRSEITKKYTVDELSWPGAALPTDSIYPGRYDGRAINIVNDLGGYSCWYEKAFQKINGKIITIGFALKTTITPLNTAKFHVELKENSITHLRIQMNLGANTTSFYWRWNLQDRLIDTVANLLGDASSWNYYEFQVSGHAYTGVQIDSPANCSGFIRMYKNGEPVWEKTGIPTVEKYAQGYPNIQTYNSVKFGGFSNLTTCKLLMDDYYIAFDQPPLGEVRVQTIYPTGDGIEQKFSTQGSALHFENIDERPTGNITDYNYSQTGMDTYLMSKVTGDSVNIYAVQANYLAGKTGVGTKTLTPLIYSNSFLYTGTTGFALSESGHHSYIMSNNPATLASWTKDEINSAELGLWATTGFNGLG
jgi:hypothetical protein